MSLASAIKALENVPAATTNTAAPEMPVNMANGGANESTKTPQASQEVKENGTDSDKTGVVEAATAKEETAPAKKEEPISSKFAALAKKEKAIVKRDQEIKAREATFAQREAAIAEREARVKAFETLVETNPLEAMEKYNVTYQKLTDMILSGKTTVEKKPEDPIEVAKKIAEDLRKEFTEKETAREAAAKKAQEEAAAQQKAELEKAYAQYRDEVNVFTKQNADKYEMINIFDQQELVIDTVNGYYEKHNRVLSVQEACDMVEAYLDSEFQKAQKAKKFAGKSTATETTSTKKEENKPASKTLSNSMTGQATSKLPAVSEQDRMKRALAALSGGR